MTKIKYIVPLLQLLSLCNLSLGLQLKIPAGFDATVTITQQKAVYMTEGIIELENNLPLGELENTLDLTHQSLKLFLLLNLMIFVNVAPM